MNDRFNEALDGRWKCESIEDQHNDLVKITMRSLKFSDISWSYNVKTDEVTARVGMIFRVAFISV